MIYDKLFTKMQFIILLKSVGVFDAIEEGSERDQVTITGTDLEIIKREMKKLKDIKVSVQRDL
ncbi:MAG: hypothetical protein GX050_05505 [Firmicutes bacterium]|nr:hypothetical protein [Bacillota bacterium]